MTRAIQTIAKPLLAPQLDYILVDGSGSMMGKWWDFMAALDTFVDDLKVQNLNSHLVVSVFDSHVLQDLQRDCTIADSPRFNDVPLVSPFGATPLYDAINLMGRHIKDLDPSRASILIVTDGQEAGSNHTDVTQARAILSYLKARGFAVTFMGCDFNNDGQARSLGISDANSVGVQKHLLTDAAKAFARKRTAHYHGAEEINFTRDEKTTFGGFLAAPGAK